MKTFQLTFILFLSFFFAIEDTFSQGNRELATDSDISNAKSIYINSLKNILQKTARGDEGYTDETIVDNITFSSPIKYHDRSLLEKTRQPYEVSGCSRASISGLIYAVKITTKRTITYDNITIWGDKRGSKNTVYYYEFRQPTLSWDSDTQSYFLKDWGYFFNSKYPNPEKVTIDQAYSDLSQETIKQNIVPGFAPHLEMQSNETSSSSSYTVESGSSSSDDEFPWEVVIGGVIGAAAIAAIRKILKKGKTKSDQKESDENEEKAGYILQLSTEKFDFSDEKQGNLKIDVIKVTEKAEKLIHAAIQITNPEPALQIQPSIGTSSLECKLILKEQPLKNQFKITIIADAEGHQYQKDIEIDAGGEPKIVFETAPGNKRSLRPDIKRLITLYAQVIDANNKPMDDLSRRIDFTPIGDWAEISESVWDDGWKGIDVAANNPNSISISSHPPATMEVLMRVELEEDKEPLEEKLLIHLLDCYLESELYHCTFPVTEEQSQIRFKVWVENAGEEIKWNFKGTYRIGVDIEDDHLTEISFEKQSETEVWVTLTGPILELPQGSRSMTKTLVISASQEEEKPIESHISVTLSKEGLFLEKGFDRQKAIQIHAEKPIEKSVELSLFRYDEKSNQIVADKEGLPEVRFKLLNTEKTIQNLISILKPEFSFDQLVTNIPYGRFKLNTAEEIPGAGETYELNYSVTAETSGNENPENFYHEIIVKVQTKDVGKILKTWEEAYRECKYMIDNYVPQGPAQVKLDEILEKQKHFLDTEGLVALRNRIGRVAAELVLAEGAEGYKEVDKWATRIETTLEWTQWAGDLCFAALASYYLKGLGNVAANQIKAQMIDAINFYLYEKDNGWEAFKNHQVDKLMPYLLSTVKGRLISIDNIEKLVGNNKALCWAVYVSTQFLFHLYQTKSMIEAAKNTGREIRDEMLVQFLGKQLKSRYGEYNPNPQAQNPQDQKLVAPKKSAAVKKKLAELESEIKGGSLDKQKVLEIMEDPAVVRTIKYHGSPELKKAFDGPRQKIYREHDKRLIKDLARELKMNPDDLEVDDFRTPGDTSDNLNTDRDYRILRKVKLANGKEAKIEVSRKVFEAKSNRIFGELTDKPPHVSDADWAARKQQLATDFTSEEANIDYSDQSIDSNTGERTQIKSNIENVKDGKSVLKNPDSMGDMYNNKVKNAGERPEKYAQAQKATKTIKKVKQSYEKQNFKTKPTSEKLEKAMKVIDDQPTDVDMTPKRMAETHKKLQDLGYEKGLEDVMKDVKNEFKSLKNLPKRSILERLFS